LAAAAVFFFQQGAAWTRSTGRASTGIDLIRYDHEWADTGFSAILLASVIMYLLVQAFKIPSGSMHLTLIEGDHLFVNKFLYGVRLPYTDKRFFRFRDVRRGDVVVFRFPTEDHRNPHYGKDFIKRAVGLPGDVIEIRDKTVFVNGNRQDEPFVHVADPEIIRPLPLVRSTEAFQSLWAEGMISQRFGDNYRDNFGPITVPPKTYFVMGDNRDRSYDGRFWGPMPERCLKGKAWVLYWPLTRRKIIR
jgi:signal peptidase I